MPDQAPTTAALEEQVIEIISRKKKLESGTVTLDSTFTELGIDSLDGMDLLFDFEDKFNLSIPDDVARQMKNVRQVVEALHTALSKPAADPS